MPCLSKIYLMLIKNKGRNPRTENTCRLKMLANRKYCSTEIQSPAPSRGFHCLSSGFSRYAIEFGFLRANRQGSILRDKLMCHSVTSFIYHFPQNGDGANSAISTPLLVIGFDSRPLNQNKESLIKIRI